MVKNVNVGGAESGKPQMLQKYLASKIEKEGFEEPEPTEPASTTEKPARRRRPEGDQDESKGNIQRKWFLYQVKPFIYLCALLNRAKVQIRLPKRQWSCQGRSDCQPA